MDSQRSETAKAHGAPREKCQPAGIGVKVLRIPANGQRPEILKLNTYHTRDNSFLEHHPDFDHFWGRRGAWNLEISKLELKNEQHERFNGIYYFFKRTAESEMPPNRNHLGAYGDVFVVKMLTPEYVDGARAIYANFPPDWWEAAGLYFIWKDFKLNRLVLGRQDKLKE